MQDQFNNIPMLTSEGAARRVGFELEFAGVELEEAANIIQKVYGGTVSKKHRYRFTVTDTGMGDFRVELDARILRTMAERGTLKKWGINFKGTQTKVSAEQMVDRLAKTVVPIEIVMPPVPMGEADKLESLRAALQEGRAEGTGVSLIHAFGMHINIECPDTDAETLLRYMRSFLILYPWLQRQLKIDLTRRWTPFVDPFPEPYVEQVLDRSYQPDLDQFIDDYIQYNPTRNRPVDFMPVFAMTQPDKVRNALEEEKNSPRPTFHYRLPNSNIDDPDWRLMDELNYWMEVERLAGMPDMLPRLCKLYSLRKEQTLVSFRKEWADTIAILLDLESDE